MSFVDEIQNGACTVSELKSAWASASIDDDRRVSRSLAIALVINPSLSIVEIRELLPWFDRSRYCVEAYIEHRLNSGDDRMTPEQLHAEFPDWADRIERVTEITQRLSRLAEASQAVSGPSGPLLADGSERYRLVRLLGRGAQGEVHEAIDRNHPDSRVAIKIFANADTRLRELLGARMVEHRSVARMVDHGEIGGRGYIAYRIVDGTDLRTHAEDHAIGWREATELVCAVGEGLASVHAAGLVHRDIKPGNIMVDRTGTPVLVDFGIAMESGLAENAGMEGSLGFMAHEQFNGAGSIPVSDVYSLAGVLYWLLSEQRPNGKGSTIARSSLSTMKHPPMEAIPGGVPPRLVGVLRRALDPNPGRRTESATRFVLELRSVLENKPIRGVDRGRIVASLFVRRHRVAVPVAIAAALLCGAGIAMATRASMRADNQRLQQTIDGMMERTEKTRELMMQVMVGMQMSSDVADAQSIITAFMLNRADEMSDGILAIPDPEDRYRSALESIAVYVKPESSNVMKAMGQELAGIAAIGCGKETIAGGHFLAADKYWLQELEPDNPWLIELREMRRSGE